MDPGPCMGAQSHSHWTTIDFKFSLVPASSISRECRVPLLPATCTQCVPSPLDTSFSSLSSIPSSGLSFLIPSTHARNSEHHPDLASSILCRSTCAHGVILRDPLVLPLRDGECLPRLPAVAACTVAAPGIHC